MKNILSKVHLNEKGAALTEFVIGLPIFLLIFSGIVSISQLSQAGIGTMVTANHKLWVASQEDSIANATPVAVVGGIGRDALFGDFKADSLLSTGAQAGGIYFDAWAKNKVASIIPGAPGEDVNPVRTIGEIHENFTDESPAQNLLDDNLLDPNVSAEMPKGEIGALLGGIANKLLNVSGVRLGFVTGIRYGERRVVQKEKKVVTSFGSYSIPEMSLSLPINTEPTHRVYAVTMVRLQHSQYSQLDSILELTKKPDMDGAPDWGTEEVKRSEADERDREKRATEECQNTAVDEHRKNWKQRCEERSGKTCRERDFPSNGNPSDTGNLTGARIDARKKCKEARNRIRQASKRN